MFSRCMLPSQAKEIASTEDRDVGVCDADDRDRAWLSEPAFALLPHL